MASRDRRIEAMRRRQKQVRFSELAAALASLGFERRSGKGDHVVFRHPLLPYPVVVDPRRPFLLAVYVRNALKAIDDVRDLMVRGGDDGE